MYGFSLLLLLVVAVFLYCVGKLWLLVFVLFPLCITVCVFVCVPFLSFSFCVCYLSLRVVFICVCVCFVVLVFERVFVRLLLFVADVLSLGLLFFAVFCCFCC